ncbi:MAG TPA: hypothetical protein HPP41_03135 [Deltaproteobacteria bacterium]|nr:hypothetical protein [Deltaproteobacteria bacterium]
MRPKCIGLLSALLIIVGTAAGSFANMEWSPEHTFQMDQSPLDMAISPDGKHIFILTESGIFVYSQDGKLEDKIDVGYPVDQIKIGPGGKQLFITSRKNKTVQAVTIDFIVDINVSGSPYRGRQDAPVVIAVFSDYQ